MAREGLTLGRKARRNLARQQDGAEAPAAVAVKKVRPHRFGWAGRGGGGALQLEVAPEWRGTTVQVCGLWPFAAGSAAPLVGAPIGKHLLNSSTVCADPINWFMNQLVDQPSAFILARPGKGKSSLGRRLVIALAAQGVVPIVMADLKPDYVDLMGPDALAGDIIPVGRGRGSINPLDPGPVAGILERMSPDARAAAVEQQRARQVAAVQSLIELLAHAPLGTRAQSLLSKAVRLCFERHENPRLSDLLELIQQRPNELRRIALDRDDTDLYDTAVQGLVEGLMACGPDGPFGSVFSEHTTRPMRIGRPTVFDVSSIGDQDRMLQAAAQAICWSYASSAVDTVKVAAEDGVMADITHFLVMDELWRILRAAPTMIDLVDTLTRLNRQRHVGQVMITHTMDDLRVPGDDAMTQRAWGFVERSALVFMGGLADREMGNLREVFAISTAEADMIRSWSEEATIDPRTNRATAPPGQGCFLLKTGRAPGVPFQMQMTPAERAVNDTNKRWGMQ